MSLLVVQRGNRNIQKSVMHVQSCCFAEKPICLCFLVIGRQN